MPTVAPASIASPAASTATSAGKPGGTLKIGLQREFQILDPHVDSSLADNIFFMAVFDRLIERTPDGKLYPSLATEWSVSDDGLTWTFKLRQGVKFHDGTPFDAAAVKFNFDRIVDPATKSQSAIFSLGPYDSTTVVDDSTIQVKFKTPYGRLPSSLATLGPSMVSPAAVQKYGQDFALHPVGTGAFVFKEYIQKQHVVITKNPDYNWASARSTHNGPAYLDEVTFQFIPEDGTRTAALSQGQVDGINAVQPTDWVAFKSSGDFEASQRLVEGYPPAGIYLNVTKAPTDDLTVRKAIEFAINKDEIIKVVFDGVGQPANGVISTFSWAFNKDAGTLYSFDPKQAGDLLDQAGWVMGDGDYRSKDGQTLEVLYITFTTLQTLAEVVQSQLKKVGVKVNILAEDNPAQQQDAQQGKHNLDWTQWSGTDPDDLHKIFGSENIGNGWNFSHYSNADVDQWFNDGAIETDSTKRKSIYDKIQQQVMEDAAYVPLYNYQVLWGFKKGLSNTDVIDAVGSSALIYDLYWDK